MALNLRLLSTPLSSLPHLAHRNVVVQKSSSAPKPQKTKWLATAQTSEPRRSANYLPSILDHNFVNSLTSDYTDETHASRRRKLIENVRCLLKEVEEPLVHLELSDDLHRLGVGNIFEKEINHALDNLPINDKSLEEDLYSTTLRFRLLRQRGIEVSQGVFNRFKDERGSFKTCLCDDPKGLLSLYEASFLALEGETTLDEARVFATRNLTNFKGYISDELAKMVTHSLELPLHWRMQRLEARWYIDAYERKDNMNPILLELAKLEYNMVQATYQGELKAYARWWKDLGLGEKLRFSRDRLAESFLWSLGICWDPQLSWSRKELTKVNQLITTIDDVYDLYGSFDELQHFTNVVDRWDVNATEQLPEYMKLCFLALFNTVNEMGNEILKVQGWDGTPYLRKLWVDLCKVFLVEAKWHKEGYKPSLEEYLNVACASVSGFLILGHAYVFVTTEMTEEALDCINKYSNLTYCPSMIFRLLNDLATSKDEMERGEIPKSIQCYMHDAGVSETVAREHIKGLISDTWKKMNKEIFATSPLPQALKDCTANLARISQCCYQYGDGFGVSNIEMKDKVMSLLVEPIPLQEQ